MALLDDMCQWHTTHTKANFETAIVSAMEQLDSEQGNQVHVVRVRPPSPKDIISWLSRRQTDHGNPPDYTG